MLSIKQIAAWISGLALALLAGAAMVGCLRDIAKANASPPLPRTTWDAATGAVDIDAYTIHGGISRHKSFADTLSWWAGVWGPGEVPIPGHPFRERMVFYRPISSYAFWLEWRWFGNDERLYPNVNNVAYFAFIPLFLSAMAMVFRRFLPPGGGVGPCLLVGWIVMVYGAWGLVPTSPVAWLLVREWKNAPDVLAGIFLAVAVMAYLGVGNRKRTGPWNLLWLAPLYLACASKEVVILMPFALPLLDWPLRSRPEKRRGIAQRATLAWTFGIAFNLFRLSVLGGVGYQYASNNGWWRRLIMDATQPWGSALFLWDMPSVIVALAALASGALFCGLRRKRSRLSYGFLSAAYWAAWVLSTGATLAFLADVQEVSIGSFLLTGLMMVGGRLTSTTCWALILSPLLVAWAIWRRGLGAAVAFGFAWILLASVANSFSPGPLHRAFVPGMGWAIVYGAAFGAAIWDLALSAGKAVDRARKAAADGAPCVPLGSASD